MKKRKERQSMYSKVSTVEFKPESEEEALEFIRTKMFPGASVQKGFKDAFIFRDTKQPQKYTLISLWENLETLQASRPPQELFEEQEHFETLVASFEQEIKEVLFNFAMDFR
jgi:heme-degrading monooxygenase HmoA